MDDWIEQEEARVRDLQTRIRMLENAVEQTRRELEEAKQDVQVARDVQSVLQALAKTVQDRIHGRISEVVSLCLSSVFDDPYTFRIVFEQKRGRTEASLLFEREGILVDPMTASGGGVVDVAAFALRAVTLALCRPPVHRILVLDEPFRFVSKEYQPQVRTMLEEMCKRLDLQIVQVTHNPVLATGRVVEVQG